MAASAVKILSNRANATHSTGPADTSRTRFNGLAHGLTSKQTVIPGEKQEEYDRFAAALRQDLKPGSAMENVLTERIIAAAWRLQRFTRVETAFLSNRIDAYLESNPECDPDMALANMFVDPAESARMRLFLRYQNAVQREYDKAFKEFHAVKAERSKHDLEAAAMESNFEAEALFAKTPVGFASQPSLAIAASAVGLEPQVQPSSAAA